MPGGVYICIRVRMCHTVRLRTIACTTPHTYVRVARVMQSRADRAHAMYNQCLVFIWFHITCPVFLVYIVHHALIYDNHVINKYLRGGGVYALSVALRSRCVLRGVFIRPSHRPVCTSASWGVFTSSLVSASYVLSCGAIDTGPPENSIKILE